MNRKEKASMRDSIDRMWERFKKKGIVNDDMLKSNQTPTGQEIKKPRIRGSVLAWGLVTLLLSCSPRVVTPVRYDYYIPNYQIEEVTVIDYGYYREEVRPVSSETTATNWIAVTIIILFGAIVWL